MWRSDGYQRFVASKVTSGNAGALVAFYELLAPTTAEHKIKRELDRLTKDLLPALNALEQRIERENADYPQSLHVFLGSERRLVSTIKHIIVKDMLQRLDTAR